MTIRIMRTLVLILSIAIVCGCSSTPPPVQELETAKAALKSAQTQGAGQHAEDQLKKAEQKFANATQLIEQKRHGAARRALQQVTVDAKLAAALAQLQTRNAEQGALQEEIDQLQRRIELLEASR